MADSDSDDDFFVLPSKRRKVSEDEESSDAFDQDEDMYNSDDEEMDENMQLPDVLKSISIHEKRALYQFKKTHTEREFEEEVLRLTDSLGRKIDMARLKKMAGQGNEKAKKNEVASRRSSRTKSKQEIAQEKLVRERQRLLEREEEEAAASASAEKDDVDDLFDEDEIEKITSRKPKREISADSSTPKEETPSVQLPPADLPDIHKVQTRRYMIEKWLNEPYFDDVLKDTFVRFYIGDVDKVACYRMCKVIDIVPYKRQYKLPNTNITTDRALVVSLGKATQVAKLYQISNSRITPREYDIYIAKAKEDGEAVPTEKDVASVRSNQLRAMNHVYTNEEISNMLAKKSGIIKAITTNSTNALESLRKKLAKARSIGDLDEMERVQKDMDKIERDMQIQAEQFKKASEKYLNLNARNKELNIKKVMEVGAKKKEEQVVGVEKAANPFARRDTRPKILWLTKQKDPAEAAPPPKSPRSPRSPRKTPDASPARKQRLRKQLSEDYSSMDADDIPLDEVNSIIGLVYNIYQLRRRVAERLGVDPYDAHINKKKYYLQRVCAHLPPLGSEEREEMRQGMSLAKYMAMTLAEQEMEVTGEE